MKHIISKIPYYLPLVSMCVIGVFGFFVFSYDYLFQMAVVVALATAYVAWGIVYHYIHRDLSSSVILEYIMIATIGAVAILTVLSY